MVWLRSLAIVGLLIVPLTAQAGTAIKQSSIAVAATSTAVATASPRRVLLILQNTSDTDIFCDLSGAAATVNAGTRIPASGGVLFMDVQVPSDAIACIHGGSGTKTLLRSES